MMKVMNGIPPAREEYTMEGSEEAINILWDLLGRCWRQDAGGRPSAQEVLDTVSGTCSMIEACGFRSYCFSLSFMLLKRWVGFGHPVKSPSFLWMGLHDLPSGHRSMFSTRY